MHSLVPANILLQGNFSTLKPQLIDKEFLQSRLGFTRVYQLVQHVAKQSNFDARQCSDILLRLNGIALHSLTTRRAALFLSRNLFMALLTARADQTLHDRWRAVCVQCVEQWRDVLKQCEGDEVHRYLQPAVVALISAAAKPSNALLTGTAELLYTMLQCGTELQDESVARTHRATLVQLLMDKPQVSAVLVVFFDKVMQLHRVWGLQFLHHIVAALKHCDRAAKKNRKDSATHLMAFVKECSERDSRSVALFTADLLAIYSTAASPTRRVLVDVLLALAHDWSFVATLAHDADAHIRTRTVSAAVAHDAASFADRLVRPLICIAGTNTVQCVVTAALHDDSKAVRLQAVKSLHRLHDMRDR